MTAHIRAYDSVCNGGNQRYAVLVRITSRRSSPNSHAPIISHFFPFFIRGIFPK
nr:MAG TPA: hypothetical protein [Caudoviricetes sp.]